MGYSLDLDLERDLSETEWIARKIKSSDTYAQNMYAALCNNTFSKNIFNIIKDEWWGCSWRHAGGIIADIRNQDACCNESYMDWYCSGTHIHTYDDNSDETPQYLINPVFTGYSRRPEGYVTDEVRNDLKKLGWSVKIK